MCVSIRSIERMFLKGRPDARSSAKELRTCVRGVDAWPGHDSSQTTSGSDQRGSLQFSLWTSKDKSTQVARSASTASSATCFFSSRGVLVWTMAARLLRVPLAERVFVVSPHDGLWLISKTILIHSDLFMITVDCTSSINKNSMLLKGMFRSYRPPT